MINVAITEAKHMIHISVYGHSGIKGESLSCAGASTLFAALSVTVENRSDYVCESGYGYISCPSTPYNKALTEMLRNGMTLLRDKFPEEFRFMEENSVLLKHGNDV